MLSQSRETYAVTLFSKKAQVRKKLTYIISIAKTASKKIRALIRSTKFLSPEVGLYLYKSTIRPCMEYYCHVWAGAPSCYLDLFQFSFFQYESWMEGVIFIHPE